MMFAPLLLQVYLLNSFIDLASVGFPFLHIIVSWELKRLCLKMLIQLQKSHFQKGLNLPSKFVGIQTLLKQILGQTHHLIICSTLFGSCLKGHLQTVGKQNLWPQIMSLLHKYYLRLIIKKKKPAGTEKALSRSYHFLRDNCTYKGNLQLCVSLFVPGRGGWLNL